MPLTSISKDPETLTLTVMSEYTVSQQRLWDAFADPRQLERFWGPPFAPATFTHHDFKAGGRAEYYLELPDGEKWHGSWKFIDVAPIHSFEAVDGDDNIDDANMPTSMKFRFDATPTGSRMTCITRFSSVEAMEQTMPGMEEGLRAAMPQLDALLAQDNTPETHTKAT